jgi:prophage regulatory protein
VHALAVQRGYRAGNESLETGRKQPLRRRSDDMACAVRVQHVDDVVAFGRDRECAHMMMGVTPSVCPPEVRQKVDPRFSGPSLVDPFGIASGASIAEARAKPGKEKLKRAQGVCRSNVSQQGLRREGVPGGCCRTGVHGRSQESEHGEGEVERMHTILRLPAVKASTGLSRSTIYLRITEGTFPKPVSLGGRAVGWLEAEIQKWLQERIDLSRETGPERG